MKVKNLSLNSQICTSSTHNLADEVENRDDGTLDSHDASHTSTDKAQTYIGRNTVAGMLTLASQLKMAKGLLLTMGVVVCEEDGKSSSGLPRDPAREDAAQQTLRRTTSLLLLGDRLEESYQKATDEEFDMEDRMVRAGVKGFAKCIVARSWRRGRSFGLQGAIGLGALTPNTVLMGWPREVTEDGKGRRADAAQEARQVRGRELMDTITTCALTQKTLIVAKGFGSNCTCAARFPLGKRHVVCSTNVHSPTPEPLSSPLLSSPLLIFPFPCFWSSSFHTALIAWRGAARRQQTASPANALEMTRKRKGKRSRATKLQRATQQWQRSPKLQQTTGGTTALATAFARGKRLSLARSPSSSLGIAATWTRAMRMVVTTIAFATSTSCGWERTESCS